MNPLIQTCVNISKAGYSNSHSINTPYFSDKVMALGKYLLGHTLGPTDPPSRSQKRLVICFGSGIDSYCALFKALENPDWKSITLLHVNYGQPYFREEREVFEILKRAKWIAQPSIGESTTTSPMIEDFKKVSRSHSLEYCYRAVDLVPCNQEGMDWENYIIPARNLVVASEASELGDTIWIIANKRSDESVGAKDKTSKFYNLTSQVFSEFYGRRITVESPVLHLSKLQMVQEHLSKGYNVDALKETFSCYSARPDHQSESHCGTCYACFKRWKLFQDLNVEHCFRAHPKDGPNYLKYREAEKKKRGEESA